MSIDLLSRFLGRAAVMRQSFDPSEPPPPVPLPPSPFNRFQQLSTVSHNAPAPPPLPPTRLEQKRDMMAGEVGEYFQYAEIKRITAMPVWGFMAPEEVEDYSRANVLADAFEAGFRLFSIQAEAVSTFELTNGLLAPIGVGFGKTLISLMCAQKAYERGIGKILLLVPSQVLYQLMETDIRWARVRVPLGYPIHCFGGKTAAARRALAISGKRGLYIVPHSLLSVKDTVECLQWIRPELIIADEAHNLANPSAARTRRVRDYVDAHTPQFIALSGTVTSKSIKDYYHLAKWTLRQNNPLPNSTSLAMEWAALIDAAAISDGVTTISPSAAGPLRPLVEWARINCPDSGPYTDDVPGFRRAYRARLNTTPGVVASSDMEIGTSLILVNQPVANHESCPGWTDLDAHITRVNDEWVTPNGDEIEHAIHTWKWLFELSSGFYNELTWPEPNNFASRRTTTNEEATEIIEKSKAHHAAGQSYARALRKWLQESAMPSLDTPMLVGNDMARNGPKNVGRDLYNLWIDWHDQDFEGRPDRDSRAVRVCSYKVDAVAQWAKELTNEGKNPVGALVWVWHQEMGLWAFEVLRDAGLDVLHCPAGHAYNAAILDAKNRNKIIVASMKAHSEGKNLQAFQHQFILQWPRSATRAEQMLGRTHRTGQLADELVVGTNATLLFDKLNFAACLNDALYIHQTTGNRQKLIYATYDPTPQIFPSAVLHERGLQNRILSREQSAILEEKFGKSH